MKKRRAYFGFIVILLLVNFNNIKMPALCYSVKKSCDMENRFELSMKIVSSEANFSLYKTAFLDNMFIFHPFQLFSDFFNKCQFCA